jgi:hypothetical protein
MSNVSSPSDFIKQEAVYAYTINQDPLDGLFVVRKWSLERGPWGADYLDQGELGRAATLEGARTLLPRVKHGVLPMFPPDLQVVETWL